MNDLLAMPAPEAGPAPARAPLPWLRVALPLGACLALAAAWHLTSLGDLLAPERVRAAAGSLRAHAAAPVLAFGAVTLASALGAPITALVVASALLFGWAIGFGIGLAGALASAAIGYGLGRLLWRDAVRRLAGRRLNRLSQALGRRGVASVVVVRIAPIAPFTVVNLVAGATHIRLRDFLLGTLVAMGPATLALAYFAGRAARAVAEPGLGTAIGAAGAGAALWLGARSLRRTLGTTPDDGWAPADGMGGRDGEEAAPRGSLASGARARQSRVDAGANRR
jgi:phospholipase D1/2